MVRKAKASRLSQKKRSARRRTSRRTQPSNAEPRGPSVDVSLEYRGPSVKDGRMSGRMVAQEILGFCDFASITGRVIYGQTIDVQPEIKGFRGSSFDIDFVLGLVGPSATMLSVLPTSPKEILLLIRESIGLWKHLRGEKPRSTERVENNQNEVRIENNSGTVHVVNINALNVVTNPEAGQSVQKFLAKPLELAGIKSVDIVSKQIQKPLASVSSNEASFFVPVDVDRPLLESEDDTGLVIESPNFREGNKWRFSDGQASFTATIEDADFLRGVNNGTERFGKGDVLVAKMRVRQVRTSDGLKAERSIVKVKEHQLAQKQYPLLLDDD